MSLYLLLPGAPEGSSDLMRSSSNPDSLQFL